MSIIEEVEQVIAQLPPEKASHLKFWLDEYKSARQYKKQKAEAMMDKFDAITAKALGKSVRFPRG